MNKEIKPEQVKQAINIMWDYTYEDRSGCDVIRMSDVTSIIEDIILGEK